MYFDTKNYLKNTRNHTTRHTLRVVIMTTSQINLAKITGKS